MMMMTMMIWWCLPRLFSHVPTFFIYHHLFIKMIELIWIDTRINENMTPRRELRRSSLKSGIRRKSTTTSVDSPRKRVNFVDESHSNHVLAGYKATLHSTYFKFNFFSLFFFHISREGRLICKKGVYKAKEDTNCPGTTRLTRLLATYAPKMNWT